MFDPNDAVEVEIEGVGKFKSRLLTERQLKEFNRAADIQGKMSLEAHHDRLNAALRIALTDTDLEDLTVSQKLTLIDQLPWAITNAELDRLKKASGLRSESQTT